MSANSNFAKPIIKSEDFKVTIGITSAMDDHQHVAPPDTMTVTKAFIYNADYYTIAIDYVCYRLFIVPTTIPIIDYYNRLFIV